MLLGNISSAGVIEQVLVRNLSVDPGAVFDVAVSYWEGRLGLRVRAGFAESCLAVGRSCGDPAASADGGTVDVDAYRYDIGGAIGLLSHTAGRWVWPYLFVGVGPGHLRPQSSGRGAAVARGQPAGTDSAVWPGCRQRAHQR